MTRYHDRGDEVYPRAADASYGNVRSASLATNDFTQAEMPADLMVLIALTAIGFATGAWLRSHPENKPTRERSRPAFIDQQVADVGGDVCAASKNEDHALDSSAARDASSDPTRIPLLSPQVGNNCLMSVVGILRQRLLITRRIRLISPISDRKLARFVSRGGCGLSREAGAKELQSQLRTSDGATLQFRRPCS
jgi:hypothetical protein